MDNGLVQFKGAASFIGNEVAESFQSGGRGAGMYSHAQLDEPMVFSGPVLFKGNRGLVSEDGFQQKQNTRVMFKRVPHFFSTQQGFASGRISPLVSLHDSTVTKTPYQGW